MARFLKDFFKLSQNPALKVKKKFFQSQIIIQGMPFGPNGMVKRPKKAKKEFPSQKAFLIKVCLEAFIQVGQPWYPSSLNKKFAFWASFENNFTTYLIKSMMIYLRWITLL